MTADLKKILYVEDDDNIAEITTMTLEMMGAYTVQHCASGRAALAALPDFKPQLVLMDMMMPEMDGLETLRHMQNMPEAKGIPVIFMTAKAQTHEQQMYIQAGASGLIVKPFDPAGLCDQIKQLWLKAHE